jgi:hypothetical protein
MRDGNGRALLGRILLVLAGATLGGCHKTETTNRCYFAGPHEPILEGAAIGPPLPCLPREDSRLTTLLQNSCQKLDEVTGDPSERPPVSDLPASCCYEVEVDEKTCEVGRPLLVNGVPRLARLSRQDRWSA